MLFDENLARDLVARLADQFPQSPHVIAAGLERASDYAVWDYARTGGFTIVSKDSDFNQLAFLHGPPPKVIWLRIGNCKTIMIESILRQQRAEIEEFMGEAAASVLVLDAPRIS